MVIFHSYVNVYQRVSISFIITIMVDPTLLLLAVLAFARDRLVNSSLRFHGFMGRNYS